MHGYNEEEMCRALDIVCSLAKCSRSFSNVKDEIKLQIKKRVDIRVGRHSRKIAVKIVHHIAKKINK